MTQPAMPNLPGFEAMAETFEFVKNMWGGMKVPAMGIPGMVMPTLSVDEINKQISDLKAVESWLTVNMNMLRGTIQALEVQSATISTLQSMSEVLSGAANPGAAAGAWTTGKESAFPFPPAASASASEGPFGTGASKESAFPFPSEFAAAEQRAESEADEKDEAASEPAAMIPPLANPAVWWNMLQEQFNQAVNTALRPETPPARPGKSKPEAASGKTRKTTAAPRKRKASPKS
jgi:hypothetical protein